ncbi:MAG: hypothetical protein JWP94_3422 [Mucilaginibacter sp.]|nr:hypothetical protein [Mucilaginibacter sp.]
MKINSVIISLVGFFFLSCSKKPDVQPNVRTTITGRFYDESNREAYPNVKIEIAEYNEYQDFLGPLKRNLIGYRGSTTTDTGGYYKITFTTSGKGNNYYFEFTGIPDKVQVTDKGMGGPAGYRQKKIDGIGSTLKYDFNISKFYYMKTHIVVHNNPFPPLNVFIGNTHFQLGGAYSTISGKNNDTVEFIPIFKNTGGFNLYFTINDPATGTWYRHSQILLNPVVDRDTIQGVTYDLFPATFK